MSSWKKLMIATSIDDIKNSYPIKFQTQMKKKTEKKLMACRLAVAD
jgi:hypothetical protein